MAKRNSMMKLTDLPQEELMQMMKEYGAKNSRTVRSSRAYLRRIGLNISRTGELILPDRKYNLGPTGPIPQVFNKPQDILAVKRASPRAE